MDAVAAEVVAVREEPDVGDQTARGDVGVELGHPCPDAVGVEDLVPGRVERVGDGTVRLVSWEGEVGQDRRS